MDTPNHPDSVTASAVVLLPVDHPQNCAEVARKMGLKCRDVLQSKSAFSDTMHTAELLFMGDQATEVVGELIGDLRRYVKAMDAIYNHNKVARAAVIQHFGLSHQHTPLGGCSQANSKDIPT